MKRRVVAGVLIGTMGLAWTLALRDAAHAQDPLVPRWTEEDDPGDDAGALADAGDDAAPCPFPRTTVDRAGRCCLPGQRGARDGCEGAPTSCAPGETHGEMGACVPRAPSGPRDAGARRARFDAPSAAGVPATMAVVPGGVFRAGGRAIEVGPFAIDRTEVSVREFRRCVEAGVCAMPPDPLGQMARPDVPVVSVTHAAAMRYCGWAGGRLPTSAEWLLAARGFEEARHPWGDRAAECALARLAGCGDGAAPVGANPNDRSAFGVLDAAGNVSEWVLDRVSAPRPPGALERDPMGAPRGDRALVRGGSFTTAPERASLASVTSADVREARVDRGFRCARGL